MIKWGRYTEEQIKKQCPPIEEIRKRFGKNTEENKDWFNCIQINVLQYMAYKIFYIPNIRYYSKKTLIKIFLQREMRNKYLDMTNEKNKKYGESDVLNPQKHTIKEIVELSKGKRKNLKSEKQLGKSQRIKYQPTEVKNNMPVRRCGEDCDFINKCKHYLNRKVKDGDLCPEDIERVDKWINAFKSKSPDDLTEDAGLMCGILELQLIEMANQIRKDGVMIEIPKTDNFGNPIYNKENGKMIVEKTSHPLIKDMNKIMATLKINLPEYLMSPKSKGEQNIMEGNIKNQKKVDIKEALKEQKDAYSKLEDAIKKSQQTRNRLEREDSNKKLENNFISDSSSFSRDEFKELPNEIQSMLIAEGEME